MARATSVQNDKLLQRMIREAKAPSLLRIDDGLYLQVSPSRSTSWKVRYQLAGKRRDCGLGPYPETTLAEARERAADIRKMVRNGTDPISQRQAEQQAAAIAKAEAEAGAVTFKLAAESYIEAHRAGWRNAKHAWQWTRTLEMFVYPKIGETAVADITTADVLGVLTPIWTTKPETAVRVRNRVELVLDAAAAQGHRDGANPARWRGHLDKLLPKRSKVRKVRHQPALDWQAMPTFWIKLTESPDTVARAMQYTILTASRTSEVLNARWQEIDLEARLWRVPGDRMKAGRDHTVPLSDAACAILRSQTGIDTELVFPGRRMGGRSAPLSNMAMLMRLRRINPGITVHGFRSTFRDWAAEETSYARDVAEMALAHVVSDATEAAYRRGDLLEKRRKIMADWATFITTKPADKSTEESPETGASSGPAGKSGTDGDATPPAP
jgi:integrase